MKGIRAIGSTAVIVIGTIAITNGLSAAEPSVSIVPGEYEMSNNMVDKTTRQCFTTDKISAATIREQMGVSNDNQCKITGSEMSGENLVLMMACQYEGEAKGTGRMTVSSSGEQMTIRSEFTINIEGQERKMQMTGKGKRIGGC